MQSHTESVPSESASPSLKDSLNDQGSGSGEENPPKELYSKNISVFDVIMKNEKIGEPVEDKWYWSRMDIYVPIRSLTPDEFKEITDRHTKKTRIGRTAQYTTEMEIRGYNASIVAMSCMEPDLQNANIRRSLAERFGISEDAAEDVVLVQKIWLIGELSQMGMAILELTGFNDDEEIVKALKGSSSGETT